MVEDSGWIIQTKENSDHSSWYIERFRKMAAEGADLAGEARLIDAMVPRRSRILDAGCGPGRVGAFLAAAGHDIVGVDVDPELIAAAEHDYPGPTWVVSDLAELDLPSRGVIPSFDAIVSAGNVMPFLAPSTRRAVLANLRAHLSGEGRLVAGFGAGRGYEFTEFLEDAMSVGLAPELLLSTWDLHPFTDDSDFLVAVLVPAADH